MNRMIRYIACMGMVLLCAGRLHAQVSYCFQSSDGKKLNLKFTLIDKEWNYGYIQYNSPEYGIFIKQKYSHLVPSYNSPGLREYLWEEMRSDTVTGTYQLMVQDGTISNIIYTRTSDKQQFRFATANVGIKDCMCDW